MLEALKKNHFLWYQGPMVLWAIALFTESSIPGDHIPDLEFLSHDKIIHFLIYTVFAFAVHRAVHYQKKFPLIAKYSYVATFIIVALYAASDELHQYFVPGRNCSLYDWFADCAGAITYLTLNWIFNKFKPVASSA
ncbi:MAG: VanZ family protein [bacterium]